MISCVAKFNNMSYELHFNALGNGDLEEDNINTQREELEAAMLEGGVDEDKVEEAFTLIYSILADTFPCKFNKDELYDKAYNEDLQIEVDGWDGSVDLYKKTH